MAPYYPGKNFSIGVKKFISSIFPLNSFSSSRASLLRTFSSSGRPKKRPDLPPGWGASNLVHTYLPTQGRVDTVSRTSPYVIM